MNPPVANNMEDDAPSDELTLPEVTVEAVEDDEQQQQHNEPTTPSHDENTTTAAAAAAGTVDTSTTSTATASTNAAAAEEEALPSVAAVASPVHDPEATSSDVTSPNNIKRKRRSGGLTEDNKCRRCEIGPSYKKGHHVSCPKSAYYNGPGNPPLSPSSRKYNSNRKSRPFPVKKPKSAATIAAYKELNQAKKAEAQAVAQIETTKELVLKAQLEHDMALQQKHAAEVALQQAKNVVVHAELQEPDEWNEMYFKLKKYGEEHNGYILFPRGCQELFPDNDEYQALCVWVKSQRNKRDKVKWQRKAALDAINFCWDPFEAAWQDLYSQLKTYHAEHGNCNVPAGYEPSPSLSTWVTTQRKNYRLLEEGKKVHQLTPQRIQLLQELGFEWTRVTKSKWQNQFDDLVAYKLVHGDFEVPRDYEPSPTLKSWITLQRTHYRFFQEGKPSVLTEDRVKMLNDIGFPWTEGENWHSKFKDLAAYHRLHGNCRVEPSHNLSLYMFCKLQRDEFEKQKKGQPSLLTPERMALLHNIGFEWTTTASPSAAATNSAATTMTDPAATTMPATTTPTAAAAVTAATDQ